MATSIAAVGQGLITRRRGSVSAHDPFGIYAGRDYPGEREVTSRLTIVRLPPGEGPEDTPQSPDNIPFPAPESPERRRASWTPSPSHLRPRTGDGVGRPGRLSFASSSFNLDSPVAVSPPSPTFSPIRRRRSSTSSFGTRAPLSPQQLCELARSSKQPRRPSAIIPDSPQSLRRSRQSFSSPERVREEDLVPVKFHPIPDGQFLPFLDRPEEVTAFLKTTPTNRLLALLEQAFPPEARLPRPTEDFVASPASPPMSPCNSEFANALEVHTRSPTPPVDFSSTDPAGWSYPTLLAWMCTMPRSEAGDAEWVRCVRACVMAHSEQICVSLLSALGVPMEGLSGADAELIAPSKPAKRDVSLSPVPSITVTSVDNTPSPLQLQPDLPGHEDEDAFRLDIAPIPYIDDFSIAEEPDNYADVSRVRARQRSGSTSSWATSRSSSLSMESIGESDSEHEEIDAHPFAAKKESVSGSATARAGSPTAMARAPEESLLFSAGTQPIWTSDYMMEPTPAHVGYVVPEEVEDLYGLCISTCPRSAGSPTLPSFMPLPVFPVPLSSSEVSRKSANVSHVLSGTPGHAGFTWRPGGPLFPTSFNGSGSALSPYERDSLAELPGRTLITDNPVLSSKNKPVTKPRSRSRPGGLHSLTSRSAHVPAVPPNSPDVHRL